MKLVPHLQGLGDYRLEAQAAHMTNTLSQGRGPNVTPHPEAVYRFCVVVAELLLVLDKTAIRPIALGAVLHHIDGQRLGDGPSHGSDRVMVVVRVEPDAAFAEQFFGACDVISPAFKYRHGYDRAFLRPAHMLPIHRWARVQNHSVVQAGDNISCRNYVHKDRVSGDYPVERLKVGGLYFLLYIDRFQFLLGPVDHWQ
jgi:hypothetical protein